MSAREPLLGLRRLTSAMTPTPGARRAASASSGGLHLGQRGGRLARRDVLADAGDDVVEDGHTASSLLLECVPCPAVRVHPL
jgi:hypothetical protein